ncbi:MAG: hypothetical protein M3P10_09990 [Actinomycetota bacterium]|nr:hypothetical protein [Actinomycetota bacterium]
MKQLVEWLERTNRELRALDGKVVRHEVQREVQPARREIDDKEIDHLVKIVDERLAEAIRREGEF